MVGRRNMIGFMFAFIRMVTKAVDPVEDSERIRLFVQRIFICDEKRC
jgi:hypothetical protein